MIRQWLENLASQFWDEVGTLPFPRRLDHVIHCHRPVTVILLADLRISAIQQWLGRVRRSFHLDVPDRPLNGCLVAEQGAAFLFVDAGLADNDQRMIVAHEFAHYLAEYEYPRQRGQRRIGPGVLAIFDGARQATPLERIEGALAGVELAPHLHYMERTPDGTYSEATSQVEQTANELALELIAPWRTVLAHADWQDKLQNHYGLPATWAGPYAERLRAAARARQSFSASLGL